MVWEQGVCVVVRRQDRGARKDQVRPVLAPGGIHALRGLEITSIQVEDQKDFIGMRSGEKQASLLQGGEEPPIVVHCSAGIGRTGTFATLDYAINKFIATGKVDIRSIVEKIRSQRASSIQVQDQYVFCHLAFLEYALNMKYVEEIDLSGFDDIYEDSE
ncbi:Uncharacterized protein FKW44_012998 [Caligus rogercresseyi]|uniref:Tyrosine-protein phosphatase non-receptor type 9 n=1 Tax=Caligus rogercresseyi TaxID=217165 RepID=A0A7T8HLA7_CALRO|nr:Uncharacterized protein FKW44_012998 [Caligus rogercresseyi]